MLAGNRYFITFVDEFSRMTWVYLIKKKSEALKTLKRFKEHVERETGRQVKALRTTSFYFEIFFQECGIAHEVIAPYTPEHNGLAERINMTIINMARCLLKEKEVPRELWGKAVF